MFAAQVGWLLAKPEGQEENRAALFGEALPDLPPTERLHDVWRELGCAKDGFNGPLPFDWAEIAAFDRMIAADLAPCEASCLVDMSRSYCVEVTDRNPLRKAPMERDA